MQETSLPERSIRRLLIANRGEIAIRIAHAARAAGIVALGIYSEADSSALHVEAMDDALCIGPAPASDSYLDSARILAAARELRADAVHPGYGFLSERAEFARAVRSAGLIFVGPSPEAIAALGDKAAAKARARELGVPVVPGYDGADQGDASLRAEAERIGMPLLIKASAGGGGRGMRVVSQLAEFDEALAAARREALAAFGDDRMLLEKYLARPRHVEFQILADAYGNVIHLGERECSIQRRHQKLIEEAPSAALDESLRERMGSAAVQLARATGYTNAGTVEFLVDERGAFYFLEMNARLQVEHPVTELVHGRDLVALQLAIANGEPLGFGQSDLSTRGWAIEARINAEDPARDFLPDAGTITRFETPAGPDVRVDTGVRCGSEVSIYYDSLLAKLIVYGESRSAAVARLATALDGFVVRGVRTNISLLSSVARDAAFAAADTTTAFLTERAAALEQEAGATGERALMIALGALLAKPGSWRSGGIGIPLRLESERRTHDISASRSADGMRWRLRGDLNVEAAFEIAGSRVSVTAAGDRYAGHVTFSAGDIEVVYAGRTHHLRLARPPQLRAGDGSAGGGAPGAIVSPMPGKIVKVQIAVGDSVAERDLLIVLEAMKMEHRIEATRDGIVKSIAVTPGSLVAGGATLVELEA